MEPRDEGHRARTMELRKEGRNRCQRRRACLYGLRDDLATIPELFARNGIKHEL